MIKGQSSHKVHSSQPHISRAQS